jgi:hypothetical protein
VISKEKIETMETRNKVKLGRLHVLIFSALLAVSVLSCRYNRLRIDSVLFYECSPDAKTVDENDVAIANAWAKLKEQEGAEVDSADYTIILFSCCGFSYQDRLFAVTLSGDRAISNGWVNKKHVKRQELRLENLGYLTDKLPKINIEHRRSARFPDDGGDKIFVVFKKDKAIYSYCSYGIGCEKNVVSEKNDLNALFNWMEEKSARL